MPSKITLEHYKVKGTHVYVTGVPDPEISVHFVLRPAVFELRAILRQAHVCMASNDLER